MLQHTSLALDNTEKAEWSLMRRDDGKAESYLLELHAGSHQGGNGDYPRQMFSLRLSRAQADELLTELATTLHRAETPVRHETNERS